MAVFGARRMSKEHGEDGDSSFGARALACAFLQPFIFIFTKALPLDHYAGCIQRGKPKATVWCLSFCLSVCLCPVSL